MKKLLVVCAFFALTGCATSVPVTMSFPQVPEELKVACPDLKETDPNTQLIETSLEKKTEFSDAAYKLIQESKYIENNPLGTIEAIENEYIKCE